MATMLRSLVVVSAILIVIAFTAASQEKPAAKPAVQSVGTAAAAGQQSAPKPAANSLAGVDIPIPDIAYTRFTLANGLTVLVHEDHKTPVVAVNTWYHVGSKNEVPGKTGFAHLFEHLMFSGSQNFDHNYGTAMERIGATDMNGTTSNDRTNYFENVPTSMLDYTLFAESDRMGHLLAVLDQKKLDLQRGVVQNEKRQGDNQPYGVVEQLVVENTYPVGHPYSWTVIGSMKDLDAASMADVTEWFKTYYGPNNVVLVIAGDITPAIAKEKVERYYGEIPAGPPIAKQEAWIAKRTGSHRGWVQDRNIAQARLYRIWNSPQYGSPEEPVLDLAAAVLGGGRTSRLYKRLVYQDQIATAATAGNGTSEIGGQFSFTLTAKPNGDLKKVEKAADEELQRFLKEGPTEAELQVAKTSILAQFARSVERIGGFGGKSDLLANCQTFTGNPDCYKDYLRRIKQATPASVRKAANDWLSDGDYILAVEPYSQALKATDTKLDRSKEPAPGGPMSLSLPPMQRATLSNGLKIVLAERHAAPVVNFNLLIDSGFSSDPVNAPGTASFSQAMLLEGTPTRTSLMLSEQIAAIGADITPGANLDWANVSLDTLKAKMDTALDIYADVVLHPAFPQKEFERLQKDRLAAIQRQKTVPNQIANRVMPVLLFGKGHPYASRTLGTEEAVGRMTRQDLVAFHESWFKPNNGTLLIVGDTTLSEITPRLEKLFASWKPGDVPRKTIPTVQQPQRAEVYLIDRPGSPQSLIAAAQLAPPRNNPNVVENEIVNDIFGGSFNSRINMNLREDKHWSYGVNSIVTSVRVQSTILSRSPVQTDKTRESMQELIKEYANIAGAKPITADELRDAQSNNTLGLPGTFETVAQLSGAYSTILEYGLPEDYYNAYTKRALALTPEKANALAKQLFLPGKLIWIVVGDMSKVEAGIRELNIGEVHKIDTDGNPLR